MSILYFSAGDPEKRVLNGLKAALPHHSIEVWPECKDKTNITAAVVWQPPAEFFDGLVNLKSVLSIAAGVDHLLTHPGLPIDVEIVRLTDAGMAEPMAKYALYGVLHAQRKMTELAQAQREKRWRHELAPAATNDFRVGVLGAGELSLVAANGLLMNGFKVSCWSRTEKNLDNITHYAGVAGLDDMLPTVDALVCLLPLTENTRGILNASLFRKLPKNAYIINPGRGDHLNEHDLLEQLDNGHLSGALLDVFATEPLPEQNPLWSHPKVIVTPHLAGPTDADGAVEQIAQSIKELESGARPRGLVNRSAGY